jgi:hypothetical protein
MSRADTFGTYYRESHARLLHQVYAYVGNTEIAQRALADAFVAAGHHWRKLADNPNKDAWIRERAFSATGRARNRARKPWYVSAKEIRDDHRALLGVLAGLEPTDRHLIIARYLADLELATAGREVGLSETAAQASIEASLTRFYAADVDTSPVALAAALDHLGLDLLDEPADNAIRLRREGNRRRRSNMLLVGVTSLAVAIGAGAVTAAQTGADPLDGDSQTGVVPAQPTGPPPEEFTADDLAPVTTVEALDPARRWEVVLTSSDFGADEPVTTCLAGSPSEKRATHYWVRTFSSGAGDDPTEAAQALEVAEDADDAQTTYERLVNEIGNCDDATRELTDYREVTDLGDAASMFTLRYAVEDGVREEQVTVVRTGKVVVTWAVRPTPAHPVRSRAVVKVSGNSVDPLCGEAEGECSTPPYDVKAEPPPPTRTAPGYLATVDLPVFAGVLKPWLATAPKDVVNNPSSTDCDNADFTAANATSVASRSYVIPDAPQLSAIFGMSETVGDFRTDGAARRFVSQVTKRVANCEDRQPNAVVQSTDEIDDGALHGMIWQIDISPSENASLVFRVALLRVGSTVTQVTFTPAEKFDVDSAQYRELAQRAGQRLQQR